MKFISNKLNSIILSKTTKYAFTSITAIALLLVGHPTYGFDTTAGTGAVSAIVADEYQDTVGVEKDKEAARLSVATRAAAIDAYYGQWNLPMEGQGEALVKAADKYDLHWGLLPAIAFLESTGGKFKCNGYNAFGWHSCKRHFSSYEAAFDHIAWSLSGNNPKLARFYKDKTLQEVMNAYNPPTVEGISPNYHKEIFNILDALSELERNQRRLLVQDTTSASFMKLNKKRA